MATDTFAELVDLTNRLDWTLDTTEQTIAQSALEDASDLARFYGRNDWTSTSAPRLVRTLVLKACKRYMGNPEGYSQSRAGDETLVWNDDAGENAGSVYFTRDEIELLRTLAGGKPSLQTTQVVAWAAKQQGSGYVPVDYGGDPFPLFDGDGPW